LKLSPTPIGVGKESVVYAGESPSGFKIAAKFHRGGVSVFRHGEVFKAKISRYEHLRHVYETRLSALAEFYALEKVFEAGGYVPEHLAFNRHVVVMQYIDGVELYRLAEVRVRPPEAGGEMGEIREGGGPRQREAPPLPRPA